MSQDILGNVEHRKQLYNGWFPDNDFVLIMDIRSDDAETRRSNDIIEDNKRMRQWAIDAIKTGRCVGLSMKFRIAQHLRSWKIGFDAAIVLQPYVGSGSMETRLMWWRDKKPLPTRSIIVTSEYKQKLKEWNGLRQKVPGIEKQQQRGIGELVLYIDGKWHEHEGTLVSLFAVSNINNVKDGKNELLDKIRNRGHYIINYPCKSVMTWWRGYGIDVKDDYIVDGSFIDHMMDPSIDGFKTYDARTAIWWMRRIDDYHNIEGEPFDINHKLVKMWMIETDLFENGLDQNPLNNQTHHVKYFTSRLREIMNHDNSTLHALRRYVIESRGGQGLDHHAVNGYLNGYFVSVAGHMVNMLLASHFNVIDINRYLDVIMNNYKNGKVGDDVFEGLNQDELWHSKMDWLLAVDVYKLMALVIFGNYKSDLAYHVVKRIVDIYDQDVREGRESSAFRQSDEGIMFLAGIKET